MKSFIIAICLFSLMTALIICNAVYINNEANTLIEMSEGLGSPNDTDFSLKMNDLEARWQRFKRVASISHPHSELDKIDITISSVRTYAELGDKSEYEASRASLTIMLNELSRLENLSEP